MAGFEIVQYTPEFAAPVAELQRRLWFDDVADNLRYLRWKYHQNPHAPEPMLLLAMAGGRAIGMRGFFGAEIEIGQPSIRRLMYLAGDAVVAEDHENEGVFSALMAAAIEKLRRQGHEHLLSFGASDKTFLAQLATAWRATAPLGQCRRHRCDFWYQLRRGLMRKPVVRRVARRLPRRDPERAFVDFDRAAGRGDSRPLVWTEEARIEEMSQLVERLGHDGRARQVRSAEYLCWRLSNPMHIRRYGYWYEDQLEGYLVVEAPRGQPQHVNVLDGEASRQEILHRMIERFASITRRSHIMAWTRCLPGDLSQHLAQCGFKEHQYDIAFGKSLPCIMVRALKEREPEWRLGGMDLRDLDNWDMRRLYNM